MKINHRRSASKALALAIALLASGKSACSADPALLATLEIPGNVSDQSKQNGAFENGVPHDQLGGFSAIAQSHQTGIYWALSDRGPDDGAVPYETRFHKIRLSMSKAQPDPSTESQNGLPYRLDFECLSTTMLKSDNKPLVGLASVFDVDDKYAGRLDPEGIRQLPSGQLAISDEYGPHLGIFDVNGTLQRWIDVPSEFFISTPGLTKGEENASNIRGRQGNGGFEGVSVSEDGRFITSIFQGPLLQDHAFDSDGESLGCFTRITRFNLKTGQSTQYVYQLDDPDYGISEIMTLENGDLLVLERDGKTGFEATCKRFYRVRLDGATNVSQVDSLPAKELPKEIIPVSKKLYLDMLNPSYGLRDSIPKKIEGVCWGEKLSDGTRTLIICTDNDFDTEQATKIYVFGVGS